MSKKQGIALKTTDRDWFTIHRGASPVLGTAIHTGHEVNHDPEDHMALAEDDRLREEDPFTEFTIRDLPNRIAFHRSRFAVDLNRARDKAIDVLNYVFPVKRNQKALLEDIETAFHEPVFSPQ